MMNRIRGCSVLAAVFASALLLALPAGASAAVPPMDAEGKRLESYANTHEMTPEMREVMRKKVPLYRGMPDREMDMNMHAMGPDYEWYVSDPKVRGPIGLLVLSHGVGENSDRLLMKTYGPFAKQQPTAIGFGMSMMNSAHLQSAVDDLAAHGAKTIVLLDEGTTTKYNTLTRHWQYIFDMYPVASYMDVPKVKAPGVKFIWTGHFDASPLITDILYDHALAAAKNPKNSLLLIVGHGPEDVEDNAPDLAILQPHVDRIKAKNAFADVRIINIQDDAILPVRESNVRKMRSWVQQATKSGREVVVVAISAASYGVQTHIRNDLKGLRYSFAEKGLAEHPKFIQWAEGLYAQAIAQNNARPTAAPATKPATRGPGS